MLNYIFHRFLIKKSPIIIKTFTLTTKYQYVIRKPEQLFSLSPPRVGQHGRRYMGAVRPDSRTKLTEKVCVRISDRAGRVFIYW